MAIISGIFNDPFGAPLANVTIKLTARSTTSQTLSGTNAAAVTAADGSYSMAVLTGLYAVSAITNQQENYLGVIQVYPDSPDGTLNEYLACFNPDDVTPAILLEMELLVQAAQAAAWKAAEYALVPRGAYDDSTVYSENDLVQFDGSEYRATADVAGVSPPAAPWELFLAKGERGEPGGGASSVDGIQPDSAGNVPLSKMTGEFINPYTEEDLTYTPTGQYFVEVGYIILDQYDFTVDLAAIDSALHNGSLPAGYTLRLYINSNADRRVTFATASGYAKWIDGSYVYRPSLSVSRGTSFLLEVTANRDAGIFIAQIVPR